MKKKELQALFDTVAVHLLSQGKGAVSNGFCRYRLRENQCAVGCLISDENYSPKLEGLAIKEMPAECYYDEESVTYPVREAVEKSLGIELDKRGLGLLIALQGLHDDHYMSVEHWPQYLSTIARRRGLSDHIVKSFPR